MDSSVKQVVAVIIVMIVFSLIALAAKTYTSSNVSQMEEKTNETWSAVANK